MRPYDRPSMSRHAALHLINTLLGGVKKHADDYRRATRVLRPVVRVVSSVSFIINLICSIMTAAARRSHLSYPNVTPLCVASPSVNPLPATSASVMLSPVASVCRDIILFLSASAGHIFTWKDGACAYAVADRSKTSLLSVAKNLSLPSCPRVAISNFETNKLTNNLIKMKRNLLKTVLVAVGLVAGMSSAWAAIGDKVTIVNQTFTQSTVLESTDAYTWGNELSDMLKSNGLYMTNISNASNNYENRDFLTFTNVVGDETHEMNVSYEVYSQKDKGQANTYYTISYFNNEGDFVFAIQEYSGNWGYGSNIIYATASGTKETAALPNGHMKKGGGSVVGVTVKFAGENAIVNIDGGAYSAYTKSAGIKAVKLSVTGGNGYDRDMYVKNYILGTTEVETIQVADYVVKYVCNGVEIKESSTRSGNIGDNITLLDTDKADIYNGDNTQKYIYVSDDVEGKTILSDGSAVITVTFREAGRYNYTVKSNFGATLVEGTEWEGNTISYNFPRYLLKDGTLYSTDRGNSGYYQNTITLDADNKNETINYTATTIKDVVFFSEAEDIETLTVSTAGNSNVRCSMGLGAYNAGPNDAVIATLPNGKYKLYTSTWGGINETFVFKAGETTIGSFACEGSIKDWETAEFEIKEASTPITLNNTRADRCIDFVYIVKTGEATTTVTIPGNAFATYCPAYPVEFAADGAIEAYKASVDEAKQVVNLTRTYQVAAGEGVLVHAKEGETATEEVNIIAPIEKDASNAFVGTLEGLTVDDSNYGTVYFLGNGSKGLGFYKAANNVTLDAGKAYLLLPATSEAKSYSIAFGGDTTGINEVVAAAKADGAYYTLSGVRVENPTKGLYIQNGKKVIIK